MNFSRFDLAKLTAVKEMKTLMFPVIEATDGGDATGLFLN
jgi:hypothetical protein